MQIKFPEVSFFFIVEPLKEPFPFLKIDLNQNYLHNFSDMKKWHLHRFAYIGDALNESCFCSSNFFLLQSIEAFKDVNTFFVIKLGWQNIVGN